VLAGKPTGEDSWHDDFALQHEVGGYFTQRASARVACSDLTVYRCWCATGGLFLPSFRSSDGGIYAAPSACPASMLTLKTDSQTLYDTLSKTSDTYSFLDD